MAPPLTHHFVVLHPRCQLYGRIVVKVVVSR